MDHELDDPPPPWCWIDSYWYIANRLAEQGMAYARLLGLKEVRKETVMRCENPHCMRPAEGRHKFRDPRRGQDDELAYVVRFFCSQECELAIVDNLERQAQYARLVH